MHSLATQIINALWDDTDIEEYECLSVEEHRTIDHTIIAPLCDAALLGSVRLLVEAQDLIKDQRDHIAALEAR